MKIEYSQFDEKQVKYLEDTRRCWLNVAEGGKRAGKNILNILAFAMNLETHPDKIHLAGGVTKAAVMMNIIDSNGYGLQWFFAGRCRSGKYPDSKGLDCLYINTMVGERVVVIAGGKDSDDYRAIKGNSYGSVYITEVNECHKTYVMEAMDRTMTSRDRKLFFDLNPKPPKHWFYADFLDYQDELKGRGENEGYNFSHFTVWNNRSISNDDLKVVIQTYDKTSMWYQADILGKRLASTGRIYTNYKQSECIVSSKALRNIKYKHFSIGVDVGGTDATVATLVGFLKDYEEVHLVDGYYHKQGKDSGMTHALYAREICDRIADWIEIWPLVEGATVFAESADKLFRQALYNEIRSRGWMRMQVVPSYKKDGIVDRIRLTNILITSGRYKIASHLRPWIRAIEDAVWDDDEYEKGEWVRVDDGSYPVDCLDSSEYGTQPYKKLLLRKEIA